MADKLKGNTKPTKQKLSNNVSTTKHHGVRTFFASIFGIVAVYLIISSILVLWLNSTITNGTVFVGTLAPLSTKPAIQNFIVNKASDQIVSPSNVQNLANALLPASVVANSNEAQLQSELTPVVKQKLTTIVSSDSFSTVWKSALQSAQAQLLADIKTNGGQFTINLHPAVIGIINQFQSLVVAGGTNQISIPTDAGVIHLDNNNADKIRSYYNWFERGIWLVIILTILAIAACIWLSVNHLRTFRRVFLIAGILAIFLAIVIGAPSFLISNSENTQTQAIITFESTLLHNLFLFCLIFGILSVLASIGTKVYTKYFRH